MVTYAFIFRPTIMNQGAAILPPLGFLLMDF
jgi:hypothetical protein